MKMNNRGITLIALVITIIIMLILAGVTISLAVNGGLFGYAGNAAKQTKTARDDEQDWSNVEGGLSTEALIAKYTSNKKEDLAKLRLYFTGSSEPNGPGVLFSEIEGEELGTFKDNNVITDASTSITMAEIMTPDDCEVIKYHNNYYKLYGEEVDLGDDEYDWKFTVVEPFSDAEILAIIVMENGEWISQSGTIEYYAYNNNFYKIEDGEVKETITLSNNEVLVIALGEYIKFTSSSNQTWYSWASDTTNNFDLNLDEIQTGLTLKKLIKYVNEQTDKKIKYDPNYPITIEASKKTEKNYSVMLLSSEMIGPEHGLLRVVYELHGNGGLQTSTGVIEPGFYCLMETLISNGGSFNK